MNKLFIEIECKEHEVQNKLAPYNHVFNHVRQFLYSQGEKNNVYIAFALHHKALRILP